MRGDFSVVIVTHDVPEAHRVSDFIAFLYEGRVVEFGETKQLFDNPRDQATRSYLAGGLVTLPPLGEGGGVARTEELTA